MPAKTYQEIRTFLVIADAWAGRNTDESKFRYAITRVLKRGSKLDSEYVEKAEDVNIDNCATDKDGVILRDDKGGFRFTKDGEKARNKARLELFHSTVEIEPHYCGEIPDSLTEEEREAFTGFVIEEQAKGATA
jgi:hypothetical protein